MSWFRLLVFAALLSATARAQYSDSVHYRLAYTGTGVLNQTATARGYVLTNRVAAGMRYPHTEANAALAWLYGQQGGALSNKDFTAALDFNRYLVRKRFYYWGLATYETSFSLRVRNRAQAGVGVAYSLVDRHDTAYLNISDGLLYELSDVTLPDGRQDVYRTVRNSLRVKGRLGMEGFVLDATAFLQHALNDREDYIIRVNAALGYKVRRWLALSTALTYNKINRTGRENLLLTFGLGLEGWW